MGETSQTMMHVASMLHLSLPEDAGPDFLTDLVDALRSSPIEPPWNMRLQTRMLMRQPVHRWVVDDEFDIDYHVRHSALPVTPAVPVVPVVDPDTGGEHGGRAHGRAV